MFSHIDLDTGGTRTRLVGDASMTYFPEQMYRMESEIDFPWMRKIFFAKDTLRAVGQGHVQRHLPSLPRNDAGRPHPHGPRAEGHLQERHRRPQHPALRRPARRGEVGAGVRGGDRHDERVLRRPPRPGLPHGAARHAGRDRHLHLRRRLSRRQSDGLQRLPRDAGAASGRPGLGPQSPRVAARPVRGSQRRGRDRGEAARGRRAADAGDPGGAHRGAGGGRRALRPLQQSPAARARADRRQPALRDRARLDPHRQQPAGDADHAGRVRGQHRVRHRLAHPVPRDERRLAGERPPDGRHPDRLRRPHQRHRDRRLRHLRGHHAERLPQPADRRRHRRRAHARVGGGLGRGEGIGGHRERLRGHQGRGHRHRRAGDPRRRPLLGRLPPPRRGRGDQRPHPHHRLAGGRPAPRVRHPRLPRGRRAVGRVPSLRPLPAPVRFRHHDHLEGRRLRRAVRSGLGLGAARRRRGAPRQHPAREGRRPRHRRGLRRLERHLFVHAQRPRHSPRDGQPVEELVGAALGPHRLHRRRQRQLRHAALRRARHGAGPLRGRRRHRRDAGARSASPAT